MMDAKGLFVMWNILCEVELYHIYNKDNSKVVVQYILKIAIVDPAKRRTGTYESLAAKHT